MFPAAASGCSFPRFCERDNYVTLTGAAFVPDAGVFCAGEVAGALRRGRADGHPAAQAEPRHPPRAGVGQRDLGQAAHRPAPRRRASRRSASRPCTPGRQVLAAQAQAPRHLNARHGGGACAWDPPAAACCPLSPLSTVGDRETLNDGSVPETLIEAVCPDTVDQGGRPDDHRSGGGPGCRRRAPRPPSESGAGQPHLRGAAASRARRPTAGRRATGAAR
jgi:hypothetical protein